MLYNITLPQRSEERRVVAHSLMVHARVSEAYIHFALMYRTDHIFPVLPIKYLINEDGDPTTPYNLATSTKPSVSHLRVLFCLCVLCQAKGVKYASPITTGFLRYLCWNHTVSKGISCVHTEYKEDIIFI